MFRQLKSVPIGQKVNLVEAIHLLDENYYSIMRVELEKTTFQSTLDREMNSIMHYNG